MADTVTIIEEPTIVEIGVPGLPGPPGPPGAAGAQIVQATAVAGVSGHRAVVATVGGVQHADPADPAHADAVVGITTGAAAAGAQASVQASGELVEPTWSWTPGQPIYVGALGVLTQTPPVTGWVQMVATALAADRILIAVQPAIAQ